MRKVIDSNKLRSPELRAFLAQSRQNIAVLTDYSAIEAYKGSSLEGIYRSMSILSDFPDQVIILKATSVVCGLNGRGTGTGLVAQLVAKEALGPVGLLLGAVGAGLKTAIESKTDHKKEMSDWKAGATVQINKYNDSRIEKWNQSKQRSQQLVEANPAYRVFQEAYQLQLQ